MSLLSNPLNLMGCERRAVARRHETLKPGPVLGYVLFFFFSLLMYLFSYEHLDMG